MNMPSFDKFNMASESGRSLPGQDSNREQAYLPLKPFYLLFKPGSDDFFGGMDTELTQRRCARVREFVRYLRRNNDNVATVDGQRFCAYDKCDLAFLYDKNFFVGMGMKQGTFPRFGMDEEK